MLNLPKKLDLEKINAEIKKVEIELNNPTEEIVDRYHRLVSNRISIRKNIIDYKVVNARDIYNTLCDMNLKSSMPYIVYRDTVNYKNNMKNINTYVAHTGKTLNISDAYESKEFDFSGTISIAKNNG